METVPTSIQENMPISGYRGLRPIRIEGFLSNAPVHVMEAGPMHSKYVGIKFTTTFSAFSYNRESIAESSTRPSFRDFNTPAWQIQSWLPGLLRMSVRTTLLLQETKDLLIDPTGNYHLLINYRQTEGVSKRASELITNSQRKAHLSITNRVGADGLPGVVDKKYVPLDVI